jgi:hypothetical protein
MSRDHFSKMMQSPYFRTEHFKNESIGTELERNIQDKLSVLKVRIFFWREPK